VNDNVQMRVQKDILTSKRCELMQEVAELKGGTGSQALEDELGRLQEQVGRMEDVVRYIKRERRGSGSGSGRRSRRVCVCGKRRGRGW
jgi:hypothetical protein